MNFYHNMKRESMTANQREHFDNLMRFDKETVIIDSIILAQTNQVFRHRIANVWAVVEAMREQIVISEGQYTAEIIKHFHDMIVTSLNALDPEPLDGLRA